MKGLIKKLGHVKKVLKIQCKVSFSVFCNLGEIELHYNSSIMVV